MKMVKGNLAIKLCLILIISISVLIITIQFISSVQNCGQWGADICCKTPCDTLGIWGVTTCDCAYCCSTAISFTGCSQGDSGWNYDGGLGCCGDDQCNYAENCNNCENDCGACPCTPSTSCGGWSACSASCGPGQQTRNCNVIFEKEEGA